MEDALKKVGLIDKLNNKIYTLSGGEQQRVALARLYFKQCSLILADEPTGSLDKENATEVLKILRQLNSQKRTVILVTHDSEIKRQCDRIIVYGDNVFEKDGIRRDRTGDGEKTRCLCGKRGIFNRDGPAMGPQIIRQLE